MLESPTHSTVAVTTGAKSKARQQFRRDFQIIEPLHAVSCAGGVSLQTGLSAAAWKTLRAKHLLMRAVRILRQMLLRSRAPLIDGRRARPIEKAVEAGAHRSQLLPVARIVQDVLAFAGIGFQVVEFAGPFGGVFVN
jgi:hypothetical protein